MGKMEEGGLHAQLREVLLAFLFGADEKVKSSTNRRRRKEERGGTGEGRLDAPAAASQ